MGNTVYVGLKEDKKDLEVTESLVQAFESQINTVDRSTEGLAKSVDSLRTSCEMLIKQLETEGRLSQESSNGCNREAGESILLARRLIETINSSVSDFEFVMMESLSKLFHFLTDIGERYTIQTEDCQMKFLIDKYMSENTDVPTEGGMPYLDARIRSLQSQIRNMQDLRVLDKKEVDNLKRRETLYRQEISTLEERIESLNKKLYEREQNQNLETEKICNTSLKHTDTKKEDEHSLVFKDIFTEKDSADLERENSTLQRQIQKTKEDMMTIKSVNEESLKQKNEVIEKLQQKVERLTKDNVTVFKQSLTEDVSVETEDKELREEDPKQEINLLKKELAVLKNHRVQIVLDYNSRRGTRSETRRYEDLYTALQAELASFSIDLQIKTWLPSRLVEIPGDKVIFAPITFNVYETKQRMDQILKELSAAPNSVFLLFYNSDEKNSLKEVNQPFEGEFKKIGGIFKFGFSSNQRQSTKERNQEAFNGLLQFIRVEGATHRYLSR